MKGRNLKMKLLITLSMSMSMSMSFVSASDIHQKQSQTVKNGDRKA